MTDLFSPLAQDRWFGVSLLFRQNDFLDRMTQGHNFCLYIRLATFATYLGGRMTDLLVLVFYLDMKTGGHFFNVN